MTAILVDSATFAFADGNAGHVCDLGSAPTVGQVDVLCANSDTVVATPPGFTLAVSRVSSQGAYVFYRIASGGEGSTVTITTSGDFNVAVGWSRWAGVRELDVAVSAGVDGVSATSTPAVDTGALAQANSLVVAVGALHGLAATPPSTPVWSSGYTGLTAVTQGALGGGVVSYVGYRTDAGPGAESPAVSWTNLASDRYLLAVVFTTGVIHQASAVLSASSAVVAPARLVARAGAAIAQASLLTATPLPVGPVIRPTLAPISRPAGVGVARPTSDVVPRPRR